MSTGSRRRSIERSFNLPLVSWFATEQCNVSRNTNSASAVPAKYKDLNDQQSLRGNSVVSPQLGVRPFPPVALKAKPDQLGNGDRPVPHPIVVMKVVNLQDKSLRQCRPHTLCLQLALVDLGVMRAV